MNASRGFSVRIFLPSGDPEGLRIVEKTGWTGQGVSFPRALFARARRRPELAGTGVYILWGPGEVGELPVVYVGEGDSVLPRLESHVRKKDFWTHAVAFTGKDQNLNKAHVQHLEARLVGLAAEAKRCDLDNGNAPQPPSLSEADVAEAEGFLANVLLCLPVVGVTFFEKPRMPETVDARNLFLRCREKGAQGYERAEGFVVRADSSAVKEERTSIHAHRAMLRETLLKRGALEDASEVCRLTRDRTLNAALERGACFWAPPATDIGSERVPKAGF